MRRMIIKFVEQPIKTHYPDASATAPLAPPPIASHRSAVSAARVDTDPWQLRMNPRGSSFRQHRLHILIRGKG